MNTGFTLRCKILASVVIFNAALGCNAMADEAAANVWAMQATVQTSLGSYSDSDLRDSLSTAGLFLSGDYVGKAGFALGFNRSEVDGNSSNPEGFDSIEENALYLSGKIHRYPGRLPGKLTLRLDAYVIQSEVNSSPVATQAGNAPGKSGNSQGDQGNAGSGGNQGGNQGGGGNTGGGGNRGNSPGQGGVIGSLGTSTDTTITVANPSIAFINHGKTFALDLGYAWSNYDYDDGDEYQAQQLTPSVGLALGGPANWLQLRGYFIHLSDDNVAAGDADTAALELKLTHWFGPRAPLRLHSVGINALAGERLLAVDPDAAVVFSLADKQTGSVAVNSVLRLGEQTKLMLQLGYNEFENLNLNNDYSSSYLYLNLSQQW